MHEDIDDKVKIPYQKDLSDFISGRVPNSYNDIESNMIFTHLVSHLGIESLLHQVSPELSNISQQYDNAIKSYSDKYKTKFAMIMSRINSLSPKDGVAIIAIPHMFVHLANKLFPTNQNYPVTDSMRWISALTILKSESNFGLMDNPNDNVFGPVQMKQGRWDDAGKRMIVSWSKEFISPDTIALMESYNLDPNYLARIPKWGVASISEQLPIIVACLLQNEEQAYKHWTFQEGKASYDGLSTGKPIDALTTLMSPFRNLVGIVQPTYQTIFSANHIYPNWANALPVPITIMHKMPDPKVDRFIKDISFSSSAASQWENISSMLDSIKEIAKSVRIKNTLSDVVDLLASSNDPSKSESFIDKIEGFVDKIMVR